MLLGFVDSISATPTVRLDLNSGPWTPLSTTEFALPSLRYAVASTMLDDGAEIPASAYDNRQITLRLNLSAANPDTAATYLQQLQRELDRPANILRYQMGSTPVFFRTRRAAPLTIEAPTDGRLFTIETTIPADPFALGLKQTLATATVAKDPAAGTNPTYFDLAAGVLIGDVETPLQLRITSGSTMTARNAYLAVRSRGTPSSAPYLQQVEAMTMQVDTATQVNSTSFSGSGNNYARTTFATDASMIERFTKTPFPASPSAELRGTYRVFLRCKKSVAGDVVKVQMTYAGILNDAVTVPASWTTGLGLLDLGFVSMPGGQDPTTDGLGGGTELPVDPGNLSVAAQRVSGSGNLESDYLVFVPAGPNFDDRYALLSMSFSAASDVVVVDSARKLIYLLDSGGNVQPGINSLYLMGGWPQVKPNQATRVYFNWNFDQAGLTVAPTTLDVVPVYWPRYLYIRPIAT